MGDSCNVVLLFADIRDADLTESNFERLLATVAQEQRAYVRRYMFVEDRKRSLLGKMLCRAIVQRDLGLCADQHCISVTKEGKPYLSMPANSQHWNFNLSHHGHYVAVAAHSSFLIGVDIVDTSTRSRGIESPMEYVEMFSQQLTPFERDVILRQRSEDAIYTMFFVHWGLKESFVKAIGLGLGFNLQQIEFHVHTSVENGLLQGHANALIFGKQRADWKFSILALDESHIAVVALGPLSEAIGSYQQACGWHALPPPASLVSTPRVVAERVTVQQMLSLHIDSSVSNTAPL